MKNIFQIPAYVLLPHKVELFPICYHTQGIFQECDKDESGTLTEDEFVNGILKSEKGQWTKDSRKSAC